MHHILLVDDEEAITDLGSQVLELYGFDVSTASNGQMALEVSSEKPVDLLVTDYQMPGMNGQELIAQMRKRQPDLPAIIVSGLAHKLSANDSNTRIFVKCVKMGELVETINDFLDDPGRNSGWPLAVAQDGSRGNARPC